MDEVIPAIASCAEFVSDMNATDSVEWARPASILEDGSFASVDEVERWAVSGAPKLMAVLVSMLLQPDGIDITSASEQDVADAVTRHVASYGSLFVDPAHEPSHGFKMREDLAVAALGAAKLVTSREPWIVRALLREWYDFEVINLWSFASNYFSLYLAPEEPLWLDSLALTNSFIHILVGVDFYRWRTWYLNQPNGHRVLFCANEPGALMVCYGVNCRLPPPSHGDPVMLLPPSPSLRAESPAPSLVPSLLATSSAKPSPPSPPSTGRFESRAATPEPPSPQRIVRRWSEANGIDRLRPALRPVTLSNATSEASLVARLRAERESGQCKL